MLRIYYDYSTVVDDEKYFPIQEQLKQILNEFGYKFTVEQKKEFVERLSEVDGLNVNYDGGYINFRSKQFIRFLDTFLDVDESKIKIEQRNKKIKNKAVPVTYIHVYQ